MDATLTTKTPCCKRSTKVPAADAATEVCDRTCRKCGTTYRVVVRPRAKFGGGGSFFNIVEWTVSLRPRRVSKYAAKHFATSLRSPDQRAVRSSPPTADCRREDCRYGGVPHRHLAPN